MLLSNDITAIDGDNEFLTLKANTSLNESICSAMFAGQKRGTSYRGATENVQETNPAIHASLPFN